jgi:hypothetical protein
MNTTTAKKLHWCQPINDGMFAFTPSGNTIRDIEGTWYVFDIEDVFVAKYATRDDAVAVTA